MSVDLHELAINAIDENLYSIVINLKVMKQWNPNNIKIFDYRQEKTRHPL